MTKQRRADHTPYIHAVAAALRRHGITPAEPKISATTAAIRSAALSITPEDDEHAFTTAESLQLTWDEANGWALLPHYPASTRLGDVPWYHGLDPLPTPGGVAAWAYLLISRPDLQPSRDGQLRDPRDHDSAFENRLGQYTTK